MNFADLHEMLRLEVLRRIDSGQLTGTKLAQQTDFQQGHISNFLNKKRALSLEGLDRVLASQGLTVDQIVPTEMSASAEEFFPQNATAVEEISMVPLVTASAAAEEGQTLAAGVIETLPIATARLSDHRVRVSRRNANWIRFVAVQVDTQQVAAMEPLLAPGMIAVIDRHYNSVAPYRVHQPTVFAVRSGVSLLFRYVELAEGRLILRPLAIDCPVQLVQPGENETPSDYIVGRVCMLIHEL